MRVGYPGGRVSRVGYLGVGYQGGYPPPGVEATAAVGMHPTRML